MNNRAHSSALELLQSTDCLRKQLPDPSISKRLTFGRHHSGTKIAEKETGSIPHCSAAAIGAPQTSRAWSGPQQLYSGGTRLVEEKPSNRNTSSSTIWASTQRPNQKSATTQTTGGKIHKDGKKPAQKGGQHPKPEHLAS